LGRGGPRISVIGLGFWQAGSRFWETKGNGVEAEVVRGVKSAISFGINFFDTAEIYGWGESERVLGRAIKEVARDAGDLVVATKVGGFRVTEYHIIKATEASRRRLGLNAIPLIQLHWPPPAWIPICKVIQGLEKTITKGLAEYYGLSNFPTNLLRKVLECTRRYEPASNQIQYSLAYRSPETSLMEALRSYGMTAVAWSPLAKGALAGLSEPRTRAQKGDPIFRAASRDAKLQSTIEEIAKKLNVTKSQVALSWIVHKGAVPIPGFRRAQRVSEYAQAASLNLTEHDMGMLDKASSRYITEWGREYTALRGLRYTPCWLQYIAIKLGGGI